MFPLEVLSLRKKMFGIIKCGFSDCMFACTCFNVPGPVMKEVVLLSDFYIECSTKSTNHEFYSGLV